MPAPVSTSTATASPRRPTLLFVGDSLTQDGTDAARGGWLCGLTHRFNRSADVLARGLCGYNTDMVVAHVLPELEKTVRESAAPPAIITVWFGANDAALLTGYEFRQHVPLDRYRSNLRVIVSRLQAAAPTAAIVLVTPGAVDNAKREQLAPDHQLDRSDKQAAIYAAVCVAEAQALGVEALDMRAVFHQLSPEQFQASLADGLHLTPVGNAVVEVAVLSKLQSAFPKLAARLERWEFPDFRDLLPSN